MVLGGQLGPLWRTVFYVIAIYDPGLLGVFFKVGFFFSPLHAFFSVSHLRHA